MKRKTLEQKELAFDFQLFTEQNYGEDSGDGDDQVNKKKLDQYGTEAAEEKKYSDKDMESAIKRRLARERRKWQREKNDENQEKDTVISNAVNLECKVICYEQGVTKESVEDVISLAEAYIAVDSTLGFESAVKKIVKKYPQFKIKEAAPYEEKEREKTASWGQRQSGKGAIKKVSS